jgi:threonine dehydratase
MSSQDNLINIADIQAAAKRLDGIARRTPVLASTNVNQITNCQVFFKCENFQRTGSFKFRGAYNALSQLSEQQKQKGVLTFSSGNHAQGIALAGKLLDIPTTIVMPENAPAVKQKATRGYGAQVILYNPKQISREELAQKLAREKDLEIIPPFDRTEIIAGQGTTALELIQEVEELDLLLVCCGGGGLISGCAIATKSLLPNCRIIGVEPAQADDATRSFHSKTLQFVNNPDTIADGARTSSLGKITFPLVLKYVDDITTVSEQAIIRTMYFIWERLKIVVEPTGVLAAAALLEGVVKRQDSKIGVIISGGNVDLVQMGKLFDSNF